MEELKDFVVPLAHDTLTREEVGERCIAAAEKRGYKADPDPNWGTLAGSDENCIGANHFFANSNVDGYSFHNHNCEPNTLITLEAFEEYCGVERLESIIQQSGEIDWEANVIQTAIENDWNKLKHPNKFGTLDRFTYMDGTPYDFRKLAEGEVVRIVDHLTGLVSPSYGGIDKDLEERPPVGLAPKWVWEQERCEDIFSAMERYSEAKLAIPIYWIEELKEYVSKLQNNQ